MSKKFIAVDLAKELGKLYRYPGVPWYLAFVLKTYDETGKSVVEIVPRNLVPEMYCCLSHANRGTKAHLGHLGTIKTNNRAGFLFGIEATPAGTYIVKLNSNVDAQELVCGFRAFPSIILKANAVETNPEKTRSVVLAAFIYLQKHAKELAARGYLKTNLRTILKIMYSKIPSDPNRLEQMANILKNAIDRAAILTKADGVILSPEYYEREDTNSFLDKSILTITLVGAALKNFFAAFDMDPAVLIEPELIEIPFAFDTENEEVPSQPRLPQDVAVDVIQELETLRFEVSNGNSSLDCLLQHALANSTIDFEHWRENLKTYRKKVADILIKIDEYMKDCYGAEDILDWWRAVLDCKTGEGYYDLKHAAFYLEERVGFLYTCYPLVVWNIVKTFVSRLKNVGALGDLGKVNCVRFWLKEEKMDWTIEELEEIVAGFKPKVPQDPQKVEKAVSC